MYVVFVHKLNYSFVICADKNSYIILEVFSLPTLNVLEEIQKSAPLHYSLKVSVHFISIFTIDVGNNVFDEMFSPRGMRWSNPTGISLKKQKFPVTDHTTQNRSTHSAMKADLNFICKSKRGHA